MLNENPADMQSTVAHEAVIMGPCDAGENCICRPRALCRCRLNARRINPVGVPGDHHKAI